MKASSAATATARPGSLWALAMAFVLLSAWALPMAWRQLAGDLMAAPARVTVNPHASQAQPVQAADAWRAHRERLEAALRWQPDHAGAHADLGALHLSSVAVEGLSDPEFAASRVAAVRHFSDAANLRPADPRLWLGLARAHLLAGDLGAGFQAAWQRAAILGPHEAVVQDGLYLMALSTNPPAFAPAMADWVRDTWQAADERKRQAMRRIAQAQGVRIDDAGQVRRAEAAGPADPAVAAPAAPAAAP